MNTLALINFAFLCGFGLLHALMAFLCFRYLTRTRRIERPSGYLPKAVVVMSLRGNDPYLRRTLLSLMKQNYPNYSVKIVIDSENDPAWSIVQDVAEQSHKIVFEYEALVERSESCGLKCSSLVQAVDGMGSEDEILVLADADVVPNSSWLGDLVGPLSREGIGVTTGNQWFDPKQGKTGSLVRNVWHAGAIIPTILYRNPWAGSCAMRLADVRQSGLLDQWRKTIVDDGPISSTFKKYGKSIHVVPCQVIVNREECNLSFCYTYIRRMLTWSRIYERTFLFTPLHMLGFVGSLVVAVALIVFGYWVGNVLAFRLALAGLAVTAISLLAAYLWVNHAVVKMVRRRRESLDPAGPGRLLKLACHFPIAIAIYSCVCLPAIFTRRVTWRGITYEVRGPWNVKMIDDRPFVARDSDSEQMASV